MPFPKTESELAVDCTSVCRDCGREPEPGAWSHWCAPRHAYVYGRLVSRWEFKGRKR